MSLTTSMFGYPIDSLACCYCYSLVNCTNALGCQPSLAENTKCTHNVFCWQKCQIFSNTVYNKIVCYCQIRVKLMPKFSVAAIPVLEILVLNSTNNAEQLPNYW